MFYERASSMCCMYWLDDDEREIFDWKRVSQGADDLHLKNRVVVTVYAV